MTETAEAQGPDPLSSVLNDGPVRKLILELWQRTRIDWGFVTDKLAAAFRANKQLGARQRRMVSEILYGMVRHAGRIDEALRDAGQRGAPTEERRLLTYLVLQEGLSPADAVRHDPGVDWQAVALIDEKLRRIANPVKRIANLHSLPDWLAKRLVSDLGAEQAESFAAAINTRAPMTVRVNTLVSDPQTLASELNAVGLQTRSGKYSAQSLLFDTRTNLFSLPQFRAGFFEAQDEGSQLIADLVAPPPKGLVIDYCAGAGGKTLAIAAAMKNRGRIVACDVDGGKLSELKRRAKRAQTTTVQAIELGRQDGFHPVLDKLAGKAHRVLVDAPCTGIGALRRNPEARWRLQPADLERLPQQQFEIMARAAELVAPGGRLIYATCTVLRAENERVVERFVATHAEFQIMTVREIWGAEVSAELTGEDGAFLQLRPDKQGCDGFFAAVLRRAPRA